MRLALGRRLCSQFAPPFVCECHNISAMSSFPTASRQTGRADLPLPAFGARPHAFVDTTDTHCAGSGFALALIWRDSLRATTRVYRLSPIILTGVDGTMDPSDSSHEMREASHVLHDIFRACCCHYPGGHEGCTRQFLPHSTTCLPSTTKREPNAPRRMTLSRCPRKRVNFNYRRAAVSAHRPVGKHLDGRAGRAAPDVYRPARGRGGRAGPREVQHAEFSTVTE